MDSGSLFLFCWQPDQILSSQLHANTVHPPPNLFELTCYAVLHSHRSPGSQPLSLADLTLLNSPCYFSFLHLGSKIKVY
ncbi:hypothetical protein AMECASPLE_034738 [Ameca splendens]|uniref:Uncharacterized protein n=1 Tax=Ameca splendens TaxID=208324 RepID=A0ABV0XWE0_9TELE